MRAAAVQAAAALALLLSARGGAEAASFTETVLAERLRVNIDALMAEPFNPLKYTQESHELQFLDTAQTEDVRQLLYEQTLATGTGTNSIDMVYAGLEDGRFVGYFSPTSHTYGADSTADAALDWAPYTLGTIDATCADAKSCSDGASADQDTCEAAACAGSPCVWGYQPCRKEADYTLAASCAGLRDGSCHAHGVDTSDVATEAACDLIANSFWHDPCTVDGCCDSALRIYYSTSQFQRGRAVAYTRWRLYDPRMRAWYREAISGYVDNERSTGWSSIYIFSTSQQLGLTATLTTAEGTSCSDSASTDQAACEAADCSGAACTWSHGTPDGVFAVDFTLAMISGILSSSLAGSVGAFAYIVETQAGTSKFGLTRGLIIGCSSEEDVMVDGPLGDCTETRCRLRATGSTHPAVATSAAALESQGWPSGVFLSDGSMGVGWEVFTKQYTGEFGLSWLVVSGITRSCETCDVWDSAEGLCGPCIAVPGLVECPCCAPGQYSYHEGAATSTCVSCDTLDIPMVKPPLDLVTAEALLLPEACPGGLPGEAVVVPYAGLWVHKLSDGTPELLGCENGDACLQGNASTWGVGADGGVCGDRYKGFMCRECTDGHSKIAGWCVECDSFNVLMFIQSLLINFIAAFALLHVSTIAVVSSRDFKSIWYKVDVHETGFLDEDGVVAVLKLLGVGDAESIGAQLVQDIGCDPPHFHSPHKQARHDGSLTGAELLKTKSRQKDDEFEFFGKGKDKSHAYHQSEHLVGTRSNELTRLQAKSGHYQGKSETDGDGPAPAKLVTMFDFVSEQSKKAPTAAVGTAIFFVQTLSVIAKDASWFGVLDVLNLDVEKSAGACVSPLPTTSRFIQYIFVTPTVMAVSVYLASPLWRMLRNTSCLAGVFEKMQNPRALNSIHRQRALLNVYLFAFSPLTRAAVEVLVCVNTSSETSGYAPKVLAVDYSISCSSTQWRVAAFFAYVLLVAMVVVIPYFLVMKAWRSVKMRNVDMQLKVLAIDEIFFAIDADGGRTLEGDEITTLLERLGYPSDEASVAQTLQEFKQLPRTLFRAMDADGSGDLDHDEIEELCKEMGRNLSPAELQKAFEEMDDDGSGEIDPDEFSAWFQKDKMRQMGRDAGTDALALTSMSRLLDIEGAITLGELHAWSRQRITNAVQTPFDILYGTSKYSSSFAGGSTCSNQTAACSGLPRVLVVGVGALAQGDHKHALQLGQHLRDQRYRLARLAPPVPCRLRLPLREHQAVREPRGLQGRALRHADAQHGHPHREHLQDRSRCVFM